MYLMQAIIFSERLFYEREEQDLARIAPIEMIIISPKEVLIKIWTFDGTETNHHMYPTVEAAEQAVSAYLHQHGTSYHPARWSTIEFGGEGGQYMIMDVETYGRAVDVVRHVIQKMGDTFDELNNIEEIHFVYRGSVKY